MSWQDKDGFRRIGRREFIEMCTGSLALAAVGCRRPRESGRANALTILFPSETEDTLYTESPSQFLVYLPLVVRNSQGELEGWLAESWEHSPDYQSWTVHLRKGVRWADDVPVTAHDIKFTLELFARPGVLQLPPNFSLEVLDDNTYAITCERGRAEGTPLDDWTVYYPEHLLEQLDPAKFWEGSSWKRPVGDGPYRFVRRVPQTLVEYEANPDYFRGMPTIHRAVLRFGDTSGSQALTELLSGNVDVVPYANRMDLFKLGGDPRFRVYDSIDPETRRAIVWNHRNALFDHNQVRRALTLAINRQELLQVLNLPPSTPVFDVLVLREQMWREELPRPLPYDPEQAKRILDSAGWVEKQGQRYRNGKRFHFTALVWDRYGLGQAAIYIQSQLGRIGLQMDIATLDPETVRARVMAGDFEAAVTVITEGGPPGPLRFFGRSGYLGYDNPQVAGLLEQAQNTVSPEKLDRIYRELWAPFQSDLPATLLYPAVYTTVAHRRVRGLKSPYRVDPLRGNTEFLWLDNRSDQAAREAKNAVHLMNPANPIEDERAQALSNVDCQSQRPSEDRPEV